MLTTEGSGNRVSTGTSLGGRRSSTTEPEQEAIRFAEALDDYEHASVIDIGGWGPNGFWLVVRDERFDISYEIASHCDYWDFIGALVDHTQYIGRVVESELA